MVPIIISRLFDPFLVMICIMGIGIGQSGMQYPTMMTYTAMLFVGVVVPAALLLFWAVQTKRMTNWDLSNRKERVRALIVFFLFIGIGSLIDRMMGNFSTHQFFFFLLLFFVGFFFITLRYKISGHMAALVFLIGLVNYIYGWQWWPLVGIIPILAWSRLTLKRHTLGEIIGGILYTVTYMGVGIYIGHMI